MIPLSVPNLTGNEWTYIKECLDTNWVSSVGPFVDRFEKEFASYTGAEYAISTVNGTAALHISLLLLGVNENDLVIAPNITFIASINAIKYTGADPVLIDISADTWQMDLDLLEEYLEEETELHNQKCIQKKTGKQIKALMPVHVLGNMTDMDRLKKIAEKYFLPIVEDASEALGSRYSDKHAGTFGILGCFSFNGNKIMTTGGGGMIVTNDANLARKAKHLTTQAKSDPFEYYHDEIGYNYRLVNILAAMGVAQLEQLPFFIQRKKEIALLYDSLLKNVINLKTQTVLPKVKANNWLYTILSDSQPELIQELTKHQIQVRPLWVPMNKLDMFKNHIYISQHNHSEVIYNRSLSLPCSTNIKDEEIADICKIICNFLR